MAYDWNYDWMDLTGKERREARKQSREEAKAAGDLKGWRQGRWLERRGLGFEENPYAATNLQEYTQLEDELNRLFGEQAGMYGAQAAMGGGREYSGLQKQLGDLSEARLQQLAAGKSWLNAQNAAWNEAETARMDAAIAARNAQRGQIAGGALTALGAGLQFIPGIGTVAGLGLMGAGGALGGLGKGASSKADYYQTEYDRLMQMLSGTDNDLEQYLASEQSSYWGR